MILETTDSGQPLSRRVRQHRLMVHRLLTHLDMLAPGQDVDALGGPSRVPGQIWSPCTTPEVGGAGIHA